MKFKKLLMGLCAATVALSVVGCSTTEKKEEKKTTSEATKAEIKTMKGEELAKIQADQKEKEKYLVIDVRSADEYKAGHLKHAVNISVDDLKASTAKIDSWKEKPVILYCNSGKKSQVAADALVAAGFKNVTNAQGVKEFTTYELVKYNNIMAADFQKVITEGKAFFVDARDAKDFEAGHAKDAINVDAKNLDGIETKLPSDKNAAIYTYCYSGNRSGVVAQKLVDLGYTNVTNAIDGAKEFEYKF